MTFRTVLLIKQQSLWMTEACDGDQSTTMGSWWKGGLVGQCGVDAYVFHLSEPNLTFGLFHFLVEKAKETNFTKFISFILSGKFDQI